MRSSLSGRPDLPDSLSGRAGKAAWSSKVAWIAGRDYAHRGLHGPGVPENSMAAVRAAIARGMGIECDVQRSGDGHAVVFHDRELDRLTAESGLVARRSADQLGAIRLTGSGETIPRLRDVLRLVDGRAPILIEIKSGKGQRVAPLCLAVRRDLEGYRGRHAVMSFDPRVPRWFRDHSPRTVRGLVVSEGDEPTLLDRIRRTLAFRHARPDFLACDVRDLPSRFTRRQRRRGLPVATWTVDRPAYRMLAERHADAAIVEGGIVERGIVGGGSVESGGELQPSAPAGKRA